MIGQQSRQFSVAQVHQEWNYRKFFFWGGGLLFSFTLYMLLATSVCYSLGLYTGQRAEPDSEATCQPSHELSTSPAASSCILSAMQWCSQVHQVRVRVLKNLDSIPTRVHCRIRVVHHWEFVTLTCIRLTRYCRSYSLQQDTDCNRCAFFRS